MLSALLHLNFRELQTQRPFVLAALAKKFHTPLRSVLALKGDQPTRLSCMLNEGRTLTLGSLRFKKSRYSLLQPCLKISLSPAKSPVFFATIAASLLAADGSTRHSQTARSSTMQVTLLRQVSCYRHRIYSSIAQSVERRTVNP